MKWNSVAGNWKDLEAPQPRPLGSVKRAEALCRSPPPSDRTMVLLDDIVQVFNAPQLTTSTAC
jgi:hypothetical protein